jgi:hypothetical protein
MLRCLQGSPRLLSLEIGLEKGGFPSLRSMLSLCNEQDCILHSAVSL